MEEINKIFEKDDNIDFLKGIKKIENDKIVSLENPPIIELNTEPEKNNIEISEKKIKNMPKKQKLIFDIMNLSKLMNIDQDEKNLKKMKIIELEKILGGLANNALSGVEKKDIINVSNNKNLPIYNETATNALYNMNFLLVKSIEDISTKLKSPIKLEGLTKNFDESEKDLKNCLSAIIQDSDYGETIKNMLSPITLYCFCMLNIVGKTATVNMLGVKNGSDGSLSVELPPSQPSRE